MPPETRGTTEAAAPTVASNPGPRTDDAPRTLGEEDSFSDVEGSLSDLMRELAGVSPLGPAEALSEGIVVGGHLRIARRLGRGGMGVVHLAHDLRLERDVALKLHAGLGATAVRRLEREAQTMARLSHPNVLTVHEVGTHEGRLYIAMEYVDGGTARDWTRARTRGWAEIVDLFVQAGDGLAAAHAAGIVHRDFKPENVLIGSDGRVRVADFGLAVPHGAKGEGKTDLVVGTPAFMAPEQFAGDDVGPAADQFAFCVAMHEALWGVRPFGDKLSYTATDADRVEPDPARHVPGWVRRIVERGTALSPDDRWPDMRTLVDALREGRQRSTRRRRVAIAAALAGIAAVAGVAVGLGAREEPCDDGDAIVRSVWSAERKRALDDAFAGAAGERGTEAWNIVADDLDAWTGGWVRDRAASCVASKVHGTQSERLLERSMMCFDDKLRDLDALLDVLATSDADVVQHAAVAAASLGSTAICREPQFLDAQVDPPEDPQVRAEVDAVEADLRRVQALVGTGRAAEAQQGIEAVRAAAEATGYRPLIASADEAIGHLLSSQNRPAEARAVLLRAYSDARRGGNDAQAASIVLNVAWVELALGHVEQAQMFIEFARIEIDRGVATPDVETAAHRAEGLLLETQGKPDLALAAYERALAGALEQGGEGPNSALVRADIATCLDAAGRRRDALVAHDAAIAAVEREFGRHHEQLAVALSNYGLTLVEVGRTTDAIAAHRRALAILHEVHGENSPAAFPAMLNLGIALTAASELDEAIPLLERTLALAERGGADMPDVALALGALGYAEGERGQHDVALRHEQRALDIQTRTLGASHPHVAATFSQIGSALLGLHREEEARDAYERSIATWQLAGEPDHPRAADAWVGLAETEIARGDFPAAATAAERAIALGAAGEVEPEIVHRAEFALARTLGAADQRTRAVELAARARDGLRAAGRTERADEIDRWIARFR